MMSDLELNLLLEQARSKNKGLDITGVLLYFDGDFMQVIEGDETNVKNLYQSIVCDDRHRSIICVFSEEIDIRQFAEWSMGFNKTNYAAIRKITTLENINRTLLFNSTDKVALIFLETFLQSHRELISH
jgi:hypothetical protein